MNELIKLIKLLEKLKFNSNKLEFLTSNNDISVYFDKKSRNIYFFNEVYKLKAILSHHKDSIYLLEIFKDDILKCSHYVKLSFVCKQDSKKLYSNNDFLHIKKSVLPESLNIILNHPYFNLTLNEADKYEQSLNKIYQINKIEINRTDNKINGSIESFEITNIIHGMKIEVKFYYKYFDNNLFQSISIKEDMNFQKKIKNLFNCLKILTYKHLSLNEYIIEFYGFGYIVTVKYNQDTQSLDSVIEQEIFDKDTLEVIKTIEKYETFRITEPKFIYDDIYEYVSKNILYKKPNEETIEFLRKNELYDDPENLSPSYLDLIEILKY